MEKQRSNLPATAQSLSRKQTPEERFWSKVDRSDPHGCWPWTGGRLWDGYGQFHPGHGRTVRAHRYAYELQNGPIPPGHDVHHAVERGCTTILCVRGAHLDAIPPSEHVGKSGIIAEKRAQTHCKRGHEFTEANTWRDKVGRRYCRECFRIRARKREV